MMQQDKFLMFENRLAKVYRHLGKQAERLGVSCFRIYDHDLPEFPLLIENYEGKLYVAEYERRHGMSEEQHDHWLDQCLNLASKIILVDREKIFLKLRERKKGRSGQYKKTDASKQEFVVHENNLKFIVNLSDYLDTGLFLDHRVTRQKVKDESPAKKILNLFCYTGSFSVYAAAGGASEIVSVDLSKTYLNWTEKNMALNGFTDSSKFKCIQGDVLQWLDEFPENYFDLVILDPPTFSNSQRMKDFLDIQRDHVSIINRCLTLMKENAVLYFSTNYKKFLLEKEKIHSTSIQDITKQTTPFDFGRGLDRKCYRIISKLTI
jgi:23S rRNA (cytosine1962-C5)-methyltransferase